MSADGFSEQGASLAPPTEAEEGPLVVARSQVSRIEQLSPHFVRVQFEAPEFSRMGNPGENFDQRVKVIFPPENGELPDLSHAGAAWYRVWLETPEPARGAMRSYTIRSLHESGESTSIIIDFVVHEPNSEAGPATRWAMRAAPGDELLIIGPRRGLRDGGGVEYAPGNARSVILAGDETAAPAISSILESVDPTTHGVAFLEVPTITDAIPIDPPPGWEILVLPRENAAHGSRLIATVLDYLGTPHTSVRIDDAETTDPLWETATFSSLGEPVAAGVSHP